MWNARLIVVVIALQAVSAFAQTPSPALLVLNARGCVSHGGTANLVP